MKKGAISFTLKVVIIFIAFLLLVATAYYLLDKSIINGVFSSLQWIKRE